MKNSFMEKLSAKELLKVALENNALRSAALKLAEKRLERIMTGEDPDIIPERVREDRFLATRNLLRVLNRFLKKENASPAYIHSVIDNFVARTAMQDDEKFARHKEKFGEDPPYFLTLSPGQGCNLNCQGCYAGSVDRPVYMDYDILSRIMDEKRELWGSYFTVISGGEPLMYRSRGKSILDLFSDYKEDIFLMYTNGTLIDEKTAEKIASLGNVFPAISVEGFEKETDARRGKGVHQKVLQAFANLREAGVPFGISVTATRQNADLISSDEFIDFYYEQQGAVFGWIFQYMPIGCSYTLDNMVTPEQRQAMLRQEEKLLRDEGIFLIDFWNGGPLSRGCISSGRAGGYFYINWNGDASPCVFFPYSDQNVIEVYNNGGDLNTVWQSPLFRKIRTWQRDYGYQQPAEQTGNWLMPCPIRDHYEFANRAINETAASPIDQEAEQALNDPEYYKRLTKYNQRLAAVTDDIWQKEYLNESRQETAAK